MDENTLRQLQDIENRNKIATIELKLSEIGKALSQVKELNGGAFKGIGLAITALEARVKALETPKIAVIPPKSFIQKILRK